MIPDTDSNGIQTLAFKMQHKPGVVPEYKKRHDEIWPELVDAIKDAGFANYSLFRRGTDVIGYCECHPNVESCFVRFAALGVGERWGAYMEGIVVNLTDENGQLYRYEEDWHLD